MNNLDNFMMKMEELMVENDEVDFMDTLRTTALLLTALDSLGGVYEEMVDEVGEAPVSVPAAVPVPDKIIFNDPATIVYWKDGDKTIVKASEKCDDKFDEEVGLAMAYMKKIYGGRRNFIEVVDEAKKASYEPKKSKR